ncbi:MAG TPA: cell envelope integrity protein CreD [Rudaea sp.]
MAMSQSITFKVFGIGFLALLMLIPLAQVQGLIGERNRLREQAVAGIAQRWGAVQSIGGPVIAVPKRTRVEAGNGWTVHESTEIVLADRFDIAGTLAPEVRRYGMYSTPVYTAELKISGRFLARDVQALGGGETTYLWDRAELRLPLSDVRGIRRISALRFDGSEHAFVPAEAGVGAYPAIAVPIDLSHFDGAARDFSLELTLAGTASLSFLPLARTTEVALSAPWRDPSFDGAFLPAERNVTRDGFNARWQVLDLNRSYGQHWQQDDRRGADIAAAGFGVSLYEPASVYQQNDRAGKYGILFIALTFVAFFLIEILRKLRVHPVQYILVGLALATFYVVLLALSEQVGFAKAYLAASVAVVALVGGYAAAVLRAWRAGIVLGSTLVVVYALLYGLVVSEQYSLLMGSIALLAVVATLMYLTRKVDWYAYGAARALAAG